MGLEALKLQLGDGSTITLDAEELSQVMDVLWTLGSVRGAVSCAAILQREYQALAVRGLRTVLLPQPEESALREALRRVRTP